MARPILEIEKVALSFYRDKLTYDVIKDISFNAYKNEFLSIIGPSGCGKSSLIRIISGLLKPSSGRVRFNGAVVHEPPKGISLVFQDFALLPWLTVLENVMLPLSESSMSEEEKEGISLETLEMVELNGFENIYPAELSGGMKQRVGIARAMVSEPQVLLMDEPFSSLDALTAEQLRSETRKILKNVKNSVELVLMVSHSVEEVVEVSDRVIALTKSPSTVVDDFRISMAQPRDKQSKKFYGFENKIYGDLYAAGE